MGLLFNTYTEHTRKYYEPEEWLTEWKFTGFHPEGCEGKES